MALSIASRQLGITLERLKLAAVRAASGSVLATPYALRWTYIDMNMDSHFSNPTAEPVPAGTLILIQNERIHGVDKKARQLPLIGQRVVLVDRAAPAHRIISPISVIAQDRHHAIVKLVSPQLQLNAAL